jgi:diamine N-acetyltransferase
MIQIRKLHAEDFEDLYHYLQNLSSDTIRRFGPHPFDKQSIVDFYMRENAHQGYLAIDSAAGQVIAYAIIKTGYLAHDAARLRSYGLSLSGTTDCTFAPSVADKWQGLGIGKQLLHYIISDLRDNTTVKRVILWGGVQADNHKAIKFYEKTGFKILGAFNHHGVNLDMILEIGETPVSNPLPPGTPGIDSKTDR